jgi:hypothetical protein
MQKERDEYKDRSRLRFILLMVLTGICSGVAVIITAPLADGGEFSWSAVFAGFQGDGGSGIYASGGGEESRSGDGVFGSELPGIQIAQKSVSASVEKYTAPSNGNNNEGNTNSGNTYTPENIYTGRSIITTNQTEGQLQQAPGSSVLVTTNQNAQQAESNNNNNALLASRQTPVNTQSVVEGVSKSSKAVSSAVSSARGVSSSNPPALPPDDGDPVDVPFDGGLTALLITGIAYGVKRMRRHSSMPERELGEND